MPKSISINTDGRLLEFTPAIADISGLQTALDGKATSSHVHGNISNAGAIGSISGLPIITTALGVLTAGAFGTIAGSFCQGNDGRLSDARTPLVHNQALTTITTAIAAGTILKSDGTNPVASSITEAQCTANNAKVSFPGFGTTGVLACVGNDSRLSDARTPTSHVHGNISNAGAIGSISGLPIITTALGVLTAGAFGTIAGSFCQGNDGRLSDARTPLVHNQAWSTITSTPTTRSGYGITDAAGLGANTFTGAQIIGTDPGSGSLLRVGGECYASSGFRVLGATSDSINGAPWYGIGYSNVSLGQVPKAIQLGSYGGILFTVGGGSIAIRGDTGAMVIGTDPGGSERLRVGGGVRVSDTITSTSHLTGANQLVGRWRAISDKNASAFETSQISFRTDENSDSGKIVFSNRFGPTIYDHMVLTSLGHLILGTDPGGSEKLRVGGSGRFSGNLVIQDTVLPTLKLNNTSSTGFINSINTNNAGGFFIKDEENNRIFFNYDRSGNQVSLAASSFRINGTGGEFSFRGKTVPTTDTFADWTGAPEYVSRGSDSVTLVQLGRAMTGLINTLRAIGILK